MAIIPDKSEDILTRLLRVVGVLLLLLESGETLEAASELPELPILLNEVFMIADMFSIEAEEEIILLVGVREIR